MASGGALRLEAIPFYGTGVSPGPGAGGSAEGGSNGGVVFRGRAGNSRQVRWITA